jgi:carbon monoxide dehydrogenase subunit G
VVRIEGELVINRAVDEAFDFVADERNEPRYNANMLRAEKTSPGPVGLGTEFRAEVATMRRTTATTVELTAFERPRRLALTARMSTMDIQGTLTFDPVSEGTRMRWSWDVQPRGVFKLMSPIVARIGQRQERTIWSNLKRLLEAGGASSPAGP